MKDSTIPLRIRSLDRVWYSDYSGELSWYSTRAHGPYKFLCVVGSGRQRHARGGGIKKQLPLTRLTQHSTDNPSRGEPKGPLCLAHMKGSAFLTLIVNSTLVRKRLVVGESAKFFYQPAPKNLQREIPFSKLKSTRTQFGKLCSIAIGNR